MVETSEETLQSVNQNKFRPDPVTSYSASPEGEWTRDSCDPLIHSSSLRQFVILTLLLISPIKRAPPLAVT